MASAFFILPSNPSRSVCGAAPKLECRCAVVRRSVVDFLLKLLKVPKVSESVT